MKHDINNRKSKSLKLAPLDSKSPGQYKISETLAHLECLVQQRLEQLLGGLLVGEDMRFELLRLGEFVGWVLWYEFALHGFLQDGLV